MRIILAALAFWPAIASAQMPSATQIGPEAVADIPGILAYQDWQMVCVATICHAEPRAPLPPDLTLSVVRDEVGPVLVLRGPLGLLLGEGVAVTVDGRTLGRLGFGTCEADGCIAPSRLDGALGRAMRAGSAMTLTVMRRDGRAITADLSLLGVSAAINALPPALRDEPATP